MYEEADVEKFREILSRSFDFRKEMRKRGVTQDDLEKLREMALSSDLIPSGIIDMFLYVFFIGSDKNFDKTVTLLHNYGKLARDAPEFFENRDVNSKEIQFCLKNQYYIVLPPTPKNYNLIFHHKSNNDPKSYVFDDVTKTFLMTVETCVYHYGPRDGFVVVIDMAGSTIGHFFQAKLSFIRKGLRLIEEACPFHLREMHILNTVPFLDMILAIVKPLLRSDILQRVFFHSTNMDYEKFYEDFIPKACLPRDYGGDLDSIEILHQKQSKVLQEANELFYFEEKVMKFEFEGADIDGLNDCDTRL